VDDTCRSQRPAPLTAARVDEDGGRAMTRTVAIFIASAGPEPVGVAAGVRRASPAERGLGAMWVASSWRGSGAAPMLAGAFYERQGFRATGRSRPFPGKRGPLDLRNVPRSWRVMSVVGLPRPEHKAISDQSLSRGLA